MVDIRPDLIVRDPLRPLDARWQCALRLVDKRASCELGCIDEATDLAVRFLLALRSHNLADEPSRSIALEPELVAVQRAWELHAHGGPRAWVVEARLLARQTAEEVAQLVSLAPDIVTLFERLFFSIADRWEAKVVMCKLAVGSVGGFEGCDLHTFLKWLGYNGGPLALDMSIPVLLPSALAWSPTLTSVPSNSETAIKVLRLARLMMWPIRDSKDAMKLFRMHLKVIESTQLEGRNVNASNGGAFGQQVRDTAAEMSQDCFEPQPESRDESQQEVSEEEPADVDMGETWQIA